MLVEEFESRVIAINSCTEDHFAVQQLFLGCKSVSPLHP